MVSVVLALATGAPQAGTTLWVFQALYPGQDFIVARGEEALSRLMPGEAGRGDIVGGKALAAYLKDARPNLECLSGDIACSDPVDSFVAMLGFGRVVMLRGGQEDNQYRFKVTSYQPATGETSFAEGTGANLDRALLAAMVKVVPLASSIEIRSEPPGATVLVDGERVGVTPYSGQVLPGERKLKLDLASHMPLEKKLEVQVRGALRFNETLEKMPARLVVNASPATTTITVDGKPFGGDKVDKPIQPGRHQILIAADGFHPVEESVDIAPGATVTLEKKLEPTTFTAVRHAMREAQEDIYSRGDYFQLSFERVQMFGNALVADSIGGHAAATQALLLEAPLLGGSLEYGHSGRYFGVMIVGLTYAQTQAGKNWVYQLTDTSAPTHSGQAQTIVLRGLQPFFRVAIWRFTLSLQGGLEGRIMRVFSDQPCCSDGGFIAFDAQLTGSGKLRVFLLSGLYLEGGLRTQYNPFSDTAWFRLVHGGLGFAF
jgi:hypothetical protein